jgi:hypothetical protein
LWFRHPALETGLTEAEADVRAGLAAYQRRQLCLKIKFNAELLDSLEATHDKLLDLKNYYDLQGTSHGCVCSSVAGW